MLRKRESDSAQTSCDQVGAVRADWNRDLWLVFQRGLRVTRDETPGPAVRNNRVTKARRKFSVQSPPQRSPIQRTRLEVNRANTNIRILLWNDFHRSEQGGLYWVRYPFTGYGLHAARNDNELDCLPQTKPAHGLCQIDKAVKATRDVTWRACIPEV